MHGAHPGAGHRPGGCLRHRVPCQPAAAGVRLSRTLRVGRPGHPPLRIPRHQPPVHVTAASPQPRPPPPAYVYPGPYEGVDQGTRRYGFHGISHQYTSRRAAAILGRDLASLRMITCHLGNGCSLAAIRDGSSIDTTMGFTPLEGLMMGTRSGTIDPGIVIHLVRHLRLSAEALDRVLNKESGLLGVSGVSGDMRSE